MVGLVFQIIVYHMFKFLAEGKIKVIIVLFALDCSVKAVASSIFSS